MGIATALLALAGVVLMGLPDDVLALPLRLAGFLMCWVLNLEISTPSSLHATAIMS